MDLFKPAVARENLHPNFVNTLRPGSASVRKVLAQWAAGFEDRDGKFVKEFQTTYNSSFWELYLFAVLKQLGIRINFSFDAPDFVATDQPISIEATIAKASEGNLDRDNIHTQPFTEKLIRQIVGTLRTSPPKRKRTR